MYFPITIYLRLYSKPYRLRITKKGQLEVDPNSKTLTYFSRLRSIWQHVGKSIDKFESIPDKGLLVVDYDNFLLKHYKLFDLKGLISKNVQRIFNRVWNYVIKGFFGSVLLTLVFPPMCLISSIGSLFLFVTSPIWYLFILIRYLKTHLILIIYLFRFPILNILGHLFLIFIFDLDYACKYLDVYNRFYCIEELNFYFFKRWNKMAAVLQNRPVWFSSTWSSATYSSSHNSYYYMSHC